MRKNALLKAGSLAAAVFFAASLLFTPETLPSVEVCWFKRLSGLPCPACGLTRSCTAIAHGRLSEAWAFHPFGYVFFALGAALLAAPVLTRRLPAPAEGTRRLRIFAWGPILLVVSLWAFGAWRWVRLLG
ncbi:MAG: DUF2752 domain-containing protein [Planctomycetota bacterium]